LTIQKFHRQKILPVGLHDFINGADIRMVERGGCSSLAPEPFRRLWVIHQLVGKKLQRHEAAQLKILGFINLSHASAAHFLQNPIVGHRSADNSV
jgi:hypothetical protein